MTLRLLQDAYPVKRPTLSNNERLGFEKRPAWLDFVKTLETR